MNEEQFISYNTILQEIELAIDASISNLESTVLDDLKAGLQKNVDVWKKIHSEILESNLPPSSKLTLSTFCDDGFKKYCQMVDRLFEA
jgi:hypothetical protein